MADDKQLRLAPADGIAGRGALEQPDPSLALQIVSSILLAVVMVVATCLVVSLAFDWLGESFFR